MFSFFILFSVPSFFFSLYCRYERREVSSSAVNREYFFQTQKKWRNTQNKNEKKNERNRWCATGWIRWTVNFFLLLLVFFLLFLISRMSVESFCCVGDECRCWGFFLLIFVRSFDRFLKEKKKRKWKKRRRKGLLKSELQNTKAARNLGGKERIGPFFRFLSSLFGVVASCLLVVPPQTDFFYFVWKVIIFSPVTFSNFIFSLHGGFHSEVLLIHFFWNSKKITLSDLNSMQGGKDSVANTDFKKMKQKKATLGHWSQTRW